MQAFSADTSLEAERVQLGIFQRMPPIQRLQLALGMSDSLRQWTAAGVRSRHPSYTQDEVALAVARLTLGDELFRQAYPGVEIGV